MEKRILSIVLCLSFIVPITIYSQEISWKKFVKNNCVQISLDSISESNLSFLDSCIGNHRVVMLGEDAHFQKEINVLKGILVKYLCRKMDFNVVAFEASMNRFCANNLIKDSVSLFDFAQSVWRAEENMEMFQYVKDNMNIAGIDPMTDLKSCYLKSFLSDRDSILSKQIDELDKETMQLKNYYFWDEGMKQKEEEAMKEFRRLAAKNIEDINTVANSFIDYIKDENLTSYDSVFLEKYFDNKKVFVEMLMNEYRWESRDSLMGLNTNWLATEYYPNKKIIVWAANAHLKANGILTSNLSDSIQSQCYRIAICNAEKMTIKKYIKKDAIFLDVSDLKNMKNPLYYRYKEKYDALIFLPETSESVVLKKVNKIDL